MMKSLITWTFAALVMGLLVVHETGLLEQRYGPGSPPGDRLLAAEADGPEELADLRRVDLPQVTWATGRVEARREVLVQPELSGRIVELSLELGASVRAGDVLAVLDDEAVALGVATAEQGLALARSQVAAAEAGQATAASGIAGAQVELEFARTEHRRQRDLAAQQATTDQALLAAATREQAAEVAVQAAEAALASAASQVEVARQGVGLAEQARADAARLASKVRVLAPLDGVVTQRLAEVGSMAQPGRALAGLRAADDLWVSAWFQAPPELGTPVHLRVDGRLLGELVVTELDPAADPFTRSRAARAQLQGDLDLGGRELVPGSYAELGVASAPTSLLLVPSAAVRHQGQVQSVRVERAGRLVTRHVRTVEAPAGLGAILGGDWRVVRSGLEDGDRVAVAGTPR
jgi:HlyD family secretion protein